ncbi:MULTISPECIES: hypothetical protein [Metallosphaera]|uniref:Uncharacterized protein n=2 Tax=Metallosphaera TaxID=41980 RepID=A0A0K1SJT3_9CREN|nr:MULTISPECIES: hypothetical protein [Metallosphaera]AKV74798.1 hypothetical protein MsedA_1874 [Metallosphaera sedula]AKV77034.1 hypothetical protein MsedB_1876 [Metallosphaera sedula]AKV79286.1 hypothetical protein MsedC_1874 [Metallosphaera sedula]AKV81531.1 hypothetical protein MsedD_1875 [Metallosphaera sedula]AKV83764.1 hypothetical protein MsedE_1875 [Metallosphaera sedula]
MVKKGRVKGRQEYLCGNCGSQFVEGLSIVTTGAWDRGHSSRKPDEHEGYLEILQVPLGIFG